MAWKDRVTIEALTGKTFTQITGANKGSDMIEFLGDNGNFRMFHDQSCCESVEVDDVIGDVNDLIGTPIVEAYEDSNQASGKRDEYDESFTWTFYRLRTIKGTVTIRWYGSSNGYYSESVEIESI